MIESEKNFLERIIKELLARLQNIRIEKTTDNIKKVATKFDIRYQLDILIERHAMLLAARHNYNTNEKEFNTASRCTRKVIKNLLN